MLQDTLLIYKLKGGDRDALRLIYEKYVNDLLTLATNLLDDPGGAEDVVQDVLIRFLESAQQFRLTGSLKGYLAVCVANRARDYIRKSKRRQKAAANAAHQTRKDKVGPVQLVIRNEQLQKLSRAMARLPYEQREVVVLRLHGELRFKQIAKAQSVSIKTVLSRYRYGLNRLRWIMNGEVEK